MDSALALITDGYLIKVQPFALPAFYVLKLYFLRLQVWGDARVIGGNKSTAVTISPIDNHLVLDSSQTLKLHSPMLAVSTCIYSGDDKRISLGANINMIHVVLIYHPTLFWFDDSQNSACSILFVIQLSPRIHWNLVLS